MLLFTETVDNIPYVLYSSYDEAYAKLKYISKTEGKVVKVIIQEIDNGISKTE